MRKNLLFAMAFFILSLTAIAQPVINVSSFPTEFSMTGYRANTVGYNNGPAGADVVWDYSAIPLSVQDYTMTLIPVSTAPAQDVFTTANYCEKWNLNGHIFYYFYHISTNSFEQLGYIDTDFLGEFMETSIVLQFPYTYNMVINDILTPDSTIRTYDAYGTLITSFGTFPDVIRQKVENGTNNYYIWYDSHTSQMLLKGNFNQSFIYFFKNTTNLAVNQNQSPSFSVFPNPTMGDFAIHSTNILSSEFFVSVYDVTGKILIANEKHTSDFSNVGLKNFKAGLYIVKITDNENQVLYSQKIIKN